MSSRGRHAAFLARELPLAVEGALQRRDLIATTMHDTERTNAGVPRRRNQGRQFRGGLGASAEFDHTFHEGRPAVSSKPNRTLAFWIA